MEARLAVATTSAPTPAFVLGPVPWLQRKCPSGACGEERRKTLVQRRPSSVDRGLGTAPPSVTATLQSSGQPLGAETRAFFETRFGHDFGRVRVHADHEAAMSAHDVNALSYTVGNHVVFGAGRHDPTSRAGRGLLAHELAHVVQQAAGPAAPTAPQRVPAVGPADDAFEREAVRAAKRVMTGTVGAVGPLSPVNPTLQRACGPAEVGTVNYCTGLSGDVVGETFRFAVNCDDFQPGEEGRLRAFGATVAPGETLEIHGFASEEGDPGFNQSLSCLRAEKARVVLGTAGVTPAQLRPLYMHGATAGPRPERRSVVINRLPPEAPATPTPSPPSSAPATAAPAFVCGPNVTAQIAAAVSKTKTTFAGWTTTQKTDACDALTSLTTGLYAWDIGELHNNAWILSYRPACASAGATPPCGSSVQVDSDCHYAGSPNYVIFGAMCKLCFDHLTAIGSGDASDFTEAETLEWVNKYKGTGFTGLATPSANFVPSQNWARAGYRGWPAVSSPAGDRPGCAPTCPTPYAGSAFSVHWVPMGWF